MMSKQTLSSKIAVISLFILLALLANWKYRQWSAGKLIQAQKQSLEVEADSLQRKNNELSQSLQYLNSGNFKESVARQQLNLKKPGEQVYSFANAVPDSQPSAEGRTDLSNPKKWLNYFFAN